MLPANLTGILLAPGVRGSFTLPPFLSKQNPTPQRSLHLRNVGDSTLVQLQMYTFLKEKEDQAMMKFDFLVLPGGGEVGGKNDQVT